MTEFGEYIANTEENSYMNSMAYKDVLDLNGPSMPDDSYYMQCYDFWMSVDPGRENLI